MAKKQVTNANEHTTIDSPTQPTTSISDTTIKPPTNENAAPGVIHANKKNNKKDKSSTSSSPRPKRTARAIIQEYGFHPDFPPTLAQFIDRLKDDEERRGFVTQYQKMPLDAAWSLEDVRQRVLKRFPRAFDDDLTDEEKSHVQLLFDLEGNEPILSQSTSMFLLFIILAIICTYLFYLFKQQVNLLPYIHVALFSFFNPENHAMVSSFKYISSRYYEENVLSITESIPAPPTIPGEKKEDFTLKLYEPTLLQVLQQPKLHRLYHNAQNMTDYVGGISATQASLEYKKKQQLIEEELKRKEKEEQNDIVENESDKEGSSITDKDEL